MEDTVQVQFPTSYDLVFTTLFHLELYHGITFDNFLQAFLQLGMILWTLSLTCHLDNSVCLEVNGPHDLYSCICLHIDHSSSLLDNLVNALNQHPLAR